MNINEKKEISLRYFFEILLTRKKLIIASSLIFALLSIAIALIIPNKYQSTILVVPNATDSDMSLSERYGGFASLAGISLDDQSSNSIEIAKEVIQSRKFISNFIEKNDLLVPLMAAKGWDETSNILIINEKIYDTSSNMWMRDVKPPLKSEPSLQEAYKYWIDDVFSMSENRYNGFIKYSIEHYSPHFTKEVAELLISELNTTMRDNDIMEADLAIEYMNSELENTNSEELRSLFFDLIQTKIEVKMLAFSRPEYIFKTIDPPIVPEKKSSPNRAFICITLTLLGFFLTCLFVLLRDFIDR